MDTTLVINPGSASKKYALFRNGTQIFSAVFERVGKEYEKCVEVNGTRTRCEHIEPSTYEDALAEMLALAVREQVILSVTDIARAGIRIVCPGTFFTQHRAIDALFQTKLRTMEDAAPLHIPHIITELDTLARVLPTVLTIGVSDSAFHTTIPEFAQRYSIRAEDTETLDIHRFGYHGLSVGSVVHSITIKEGVFPKRAIVCHTGSGVSVTALTEGKSFDTTMGFSPTSGLMMNSRAGDLDVGALLYIMRKKDMSVLDAEQYVSEEGGLRGMLGQSDLRIALDRMARGERDATAAVQLFIHYLKKAIGAYVAVLGGIDLLILTGTVAERNPTVRALLCTGLEGVGIPLDHSRNESVTNGEGIISTPKSTARIIVTHTNEMGEIARVAESMV
jgi:acetate kinase